MNSFDLIFQETLNFDWKIRFFLVYVMTSASKVGQIFTQVIISSSNLKYFVHKNQQMPISKPYQMQMLPFIYQTQL